MSRWIVPEEYVVVLGGNKYVNCKTIVDYKGSNVFELLRSATDGYLGISFDLHDKSGKRVGTVRNGVFVTPGPEGYSIRDGADHYTLTEDATGRVVCDLRFRSLATGDAEIEVAADMYMPDGFLLKFSSAETKIGGTRMMGNVFVGGSAIKIG